jgi:DnaK suppressor protein
MKGTNLTWFKNLLDSKRCALEHELREGLRERERVAAGQPSCDPVDRMTDATQREISMHELESKSHLLRSVRAALDRIAAGTYGTCVYCDEEIAGKRLEAVPWTHSCIACQEQLERNGAHFNTSTSTSFTHAA